MSDTQHNLPVIQANLQKKISASSSFSRHLGNSHNTLAIVQEPRVIGRRISNVPSTHKAFVGSTKVPPRAAILVPKDLSSDCFILSEWSTRDSVAIRLGR